MPSKIKIILFSLVGLLVITQFTNCDNFSETVSGFHYSSGLCLASDSCNNPNPENIRISLSANNFVSDKHSFANIAGECSVGNYKNHAISWRSVGGSGDSGTVENACQNGQFVLRVSTSGLEQGRSQQVSIKIVAIENGREVAGVFPDSVINLSK